MTDQKPRLHAEALIRSRTTNMCGIDKSLAVQRLLRHHSWSCCMAQTEQSAAIHRNANYPCTAMHISHRHSSAHMTTRPHEYRHLVTLILCVTERDKPLARTTSRDTRPLQTHIWRKRLPATAHTGCARHMDVSEARTFPFSSFSHTTLALAASRPASSTVTFLALSPHTTREPSDEKPTLSTCGREGGEGW